MANLRMKPFRYDQSETQTTQVWQIWKSNHSDTTNLKLKPLWYDQSETQPTQVWQIRNSNHSRYGKCEWVLSEFSYVLVRKFQIWKLNYLDMTNPKVKPLDIDWTFGSVQPQRIRFGWAWGARRFLRAFNVNGEDGGGGDRQWQVKKCTPALSKKESLKLV